MLESSESVTSFYQSKDVVAIKGNHFLTFDQVYAHYLTCSENITNDEYTHEKKKVSNMVKVDLPRTDIGNQNYNNNEKDFITQRKNPLFNVLMAYAAFDPKIGYVQGLNLMAAFFLNNYNLNDEYYE